MWWVTTALAYPLVYPDPVEVKLGDLDGDGHLDVVVGGAEAVHFGDGTGGFGPLEPLDKVGVADDVLLTDLDGDGAPEVCRMYFDRLECHSGGGRSLGPVLFTDPRRFFALHATDADADGDIDLIVSLLSTWELLRNDGAGSFTAEVLTAAAPPFDRFVEADVDGDGDLDLAGVDYGDVWWLARDAGGELGDPQLLHSVAGGFSFAIADVDADGLPDLLTQSYTFPLYVYGRRSNGTYRGAQPTAWSGTFTLADLAGTGTPGLLVANDDDLVYWDAGIDDNGVALWSTVDGEDRLTRLVAGDLDEDGGLDVLIRDRDVRVTLDPLGAAVHQTLQRRPLAAGPAAVGDLDGDGLLDVLYTEADAPYEAFWLRGTGGGAFDLPVTVAALAGEPRVVELVDLDRDGHLDLVAQLAGGAVVVHLGTGAGVLGAGAALAGVTSRGSGVLVDADRDGAIEWVVAVAGGGMQVIDDDGAGGIVAGSVQGVDLLGAMTSADTDGDGWPEIAALAHGEVLLYRTDPAGPVEVGRLPVFRDAYGLGAADRDGDGLAHLVLVRPCQTTLVYGTYEVCVTGERAYDLAEAAGSLVMVGPLGELAPPLAAVDWTDDGADELVGFDSYQLFAFDTTFSRTPLLRVLDATELDPGDLDDDGDIDLVVVSTDGLRIAWNPSEMPVSEPGETGDTGAPPSEPPDTGAPTTSTDDSGGAPDPGSTEPSGGCGCATAAPGGWLALLTVLALGVRRRR